MKVPVTTIIAKKLRAGTQSKATTLTGIGGLLTGVTMLIQGIWGGESVDGEVVVTALGLLSVGIGSLFARDGDVSSEDSTNNKA